MSLLLTFALLQAAPAIPVTAPRLAIEEVTLSNGMRFLIHERRDVPLIAAGWAAHVGSVDETEGATGLSHLFEHMMFKGTRTIGARDVKAELALMAQQEKVREAMRAEQAAARLRERRGDGPEAAATTRLQELQRQFDALVTRQRELVVKDELDALYTRNGAVGLNATTNEDATLYFVQIPSNRLELWAWLESDRLANPVFREFYSELDVVMEERRMRVESTPLGRHDEAWNALFWQASPYRRPVIGWPSDLRAITQPQAEAFFARHYAPGNLTAVLVGDVRIAEAKPILERYFGRIPQRALAPDVVTSEPAQTGEKRYRAEADTSPTVRMWWHAVPFAHRDRAALDLLSDLLSGRTGRLYKSLVLGAGIANSGGAYIDLKKYEGLFAIEVVAKDGQDPAAVEAAIDAEVTKVRDELVGETELRKLKNQAAADAFRRVSSPFGIMVQLLTYDSLGDPRYLERAAAELEAVTPADLQRVARTYLTRDGRTVGVFLRKEAR